jgi:hypothetical protein
MNRTNKGLRRDSMKTKMICVIGAISFFCLVPLVCSSAAQSSLLIPFETIAQGDISYYNYGDSGFTGADLLIKGERAWAWFWEMHTAGIEPQPPVPAIDFVREMVIVAILGYQSSGGGPGVTVLEVAHEAPSRALHVVIGENENPGPLTVITNPFHIIKLKRTGATSVAFDHNKFE